MIVLLLAMYLPMHLPCSDKTEPDPSGLTYCELNELEAAKRVIDHAPMFRQEPVPPVGATKRVQLKDGSSHWKDEKGKDYGIVQPGKTFSDHAARQSHLDSAQRDIQAAHPGFRLETAWNGDKDVTQAEFAKLYPFGRLVKRQPN